MTNVHRHDVLTASAIAAAALAVKLLSLDMFGLWLNGAFLSPQMTRPAPQWAIQFNLIFWPVISDLEGCIALVIFLSCRSRVKWALFLFLFAFYNLLSVPTFMVWMALDKQRYAVYAQTFGLPLNMTFRMDIVALAAVLFVAIICLGSFCLRRMQTFDFRLASVALLLPIIFDVGFRMAMVLEPAFHGLALFKVIGSEFLLDTINELVTGLSFFFMIVVGGGSRPNRTGNYIERNVRVVAVGAILITIYFFQYQIRQMVGL